MDYPVLFLIALVLVLVLSAAVLKWRANAKLFETCWKESDGKRADLEVRIADTENERLNLTVDLSNLAAELRLRELENNRLKWDIEQLGYYKMSAKKELDELRDFAHAKVTVRLQRILDYSHQYDASTRKEIRGLAAKLMRV